MSRSYLDSRKLALSFLLHLTHCNDEVQSSIAELSSGFSPLSGLISLTGVPSSLFNSFPQMLGSLKDHLEERSQFIRDIALNFSPKKNSDSPIKREELQE